MTGTAGAAWKGGGEIKALRRIVGGSAEEDEDMPAPVGHNHAPAAAVHESTGSAIALEEQALVVERVLAEAEGVVERAGRELLKLRDCFCEVDLGRHAKIERLHAEGMSTREISAQVGLSPITVRHYNKRAVKGRKVRLGRGEAERFLTWAQARFKRSKATLRSYIRFAKNPEGKRTGDIRDAERNKKHRRLSSLMMASLNGNVAPPVFKQAFVALGDRGTPQRTAVACWIAALEAGSDDPQEVARWFAAHRLV